MGQLDRRLRALELAAGVVHEADRRAVLDAFDNWLLANATEVERAAWNRDMLHMPMTDGDLSDLGLTRSEADRIRAGVGAILPGDEELIDGLWDRVPDDLLESLCAVLVEAGDRLQSI